MSSPLTTKWKWNRLSHWGVNHKVVEVARRMVLNEVISPRFVVMNNCVAPFLARGLIVHTQYGHLVPGSEDEFFDVVNPVLWAEEVGTVLVELDAEKRLRGY